LTSDRPAWWDWPLKITDHCYRRMTLRNISETDLRAMLEDASGLRPDELQGRWVAECYHQGSDWEVVLEPELELESLAVVTAFKV